MKNLKAAIFLLLLTISFSSYSQERPQAKKVKITGKIIEKSTNLPLGYATVTLTNSKRPDVVTGGMTDEQGNFSVEANAGTYDVKFEFISFKIIDLKQQAITDDKNFGTISLEAEAEMLDAVEIRAERSTVEIKLDKKVYNVGSDMIVKGGTVSDVLDNVPSVSVDVEGNVSLRGNENVRILIDGRPSGGININDVLKLLPADSVDKVEVITNPSARYDAEGGGGIINIVMKKGKNQGITGTVTLSTGDPANHGITGTVNYKTDKFNLFTTQGYSYRKGPGNSMTDTEYLDKDTHETTGFLKERRNNERLNKSYNGSFGMDLFVNKSTTWTNTVSYRRSTGENPDNVMLYNFDRDFNPTFTTNRLNNQADKDMNVEFSSNLVKKFKKDGHQLTVDFSVSKSNDDENSLIEVSSNDILTNQKNQTTANLQDQNRTMLQADYVLPLGEKSQFEAGYRGNFTDLTTDYAVEDFKDGIWVNNEDYTNILQYKENVNALYTQFGSKITSKISYLLGLRWEDSNIEVNQFTTNDFRNKKYNNFFPSAFLAYEFGEGTSASISYSRRISRPRSRSINPFSNLSSNINQFRGNPDLDPSMSDAFDLGFLKKWDKLTFNTSMYFNRTQDAVQFVKNVETNADTNTDILITSPRNIGVEDRFGFEFTLSYNPYKWWKMNSNFNLFRNQTKGNYTFTNLNNEVEVIDFSNTAYSWFARINSRINLPLGIDWQTNGTYNAPQTNAQGKSKGIASMNLAFSKDVLKDKATIALNVNDVFNSRKRIIESNLPVQNSYSEMQWRERQISLTFTYRFNKKKTEREKTAKKPGSDSENGGGEEYGG
ncbi:outer membrane beta-barrel family protein [uncultured Flavobacterium sp.]|uniref:outer membrane beta-barrel family protein n=1 Tax=uncultured Flavobacterium sp. TaxID=165435 RepID=UPI0025D2903C|nr:outer membrane beta-barrel family protein [uncultured Flavobacterium sp.]